MGPQGAAVEEDLMAIDVNIPPGAQPRELVLEAVTELFDQVVDANTAGVRPPQLLPSIDAARNAQRADNVPELERCLLDVAHAAIASLVRVRASHEPDDPRIT